MKKGMIKVTVLYPDGDGKTFNMDYYCNTHVPMVTQLFGGALKAMSVDKGIGGGAPGASAPYLAIGHLYFETVADFQNAFGTHAEKIIGDTPNYTNVEPVVQINEVQL